HIRPPRAPQISPIDRHSHSTCYSVFSQPRQPDPPPPPHPTRRSPDLRTSATPESTAPMTNRPGSGLPDTSSATPLGCRRTGAPRSEEHTSELQSRFDVVCRRLREKKHCRYTKQWAVRRSSGKHKSTSE